MLLPLTVRADNVEIKNEVTDNFSHELVVCGSYFFIVSQGLKKSNKQEEADHYMKAYNMATLYALMAAEQSRSKELAQKVTMSRFEMSVKEMFKDIENDYRNISILMYKYADKCKAALEDPESLMNGWVDKIQRNNESNN